MGKRKSSSGAAKHRPRGSGRAPPEDGRRAVVVDAGGDSWLYGFHAVAAALANPRRHCRHLLATAAAARAPALSAGGGRDDLTVETAGRDDIADRLPPGAVHQGVALLCDPLPAPSLDEVCGRPGPVIVLDQATDPRNVGAVMRSAAAFGAAALIVPRRHSAPASGALAKAASGALETLPLVRVANLVRGLARLQEAGFWCVGLDPAAANTLGGARLGTRTALVLGAEGRGLRRLTGEACDDVVRIPMSSAGGSLNLSAAAAIALYEVSRGAA